MDNGIHSSLLSSTMRMVCCKDLSITDGVAKFDSSITVIRESEGEDMCTFDSLGKRRLNTVHSPFSSFMVKQRISP
ncbi:hypothetical protein KUH03_15020 [Sphingobacterium sp. E70]|nr:hypothetical protein [Sphingobacterium sp. E70]ULT27833.1 hypothetical protein KUH03_15020 [Sphingobacterium sp. E70]